MKLYLTFLSLSFVLLSCAPTKHYVYSFTMRKPTVSDKLIYDNDTMNISFSVRTKTISFTIVNKTEDGIKINWDEVSFSVGTKTYRVVHSQTGAIRVHEVQPPTTIPPHATMKDFIAPSGNVYFDTEFFTNAPVVKLKEIFPAIDYGKKHIREYILSRKGKTIIIFLPFYMRGAYVSKYYEISIDDVKSKKK